MLLENKVAVISGGASPRGIGFATARLFAQHGAAVAILDIDEAGAQRAARELGSAHLGLGCDVADAERYRAAARLVLDRFQHVDVLINNAGITQPVRTMDITAAASGRVPRRGGAADAARPLRHLGRGDGGLRQRLAVALTRRRRPSTRTGGASSARRPLAR